MKAFKKVIAIALGLSLSLSMAVLASAQENDTATTLHSQLAAEEIETLNARQSINVTIPAYDSKTYYVSTPSVFDVSINFSQASPRFAVEVNDGSVIMSKVFDNPSMPASYYDGSGYYSSGSAYLIIANDSPYSSNFVGSVTFPRH